MRPWRSPMGGAASGERWATRSGEGPAEEVCAGEGVVRVAAHRGRALRNISRTATDRG